MAEHHRRPVELVRDHVRVSADYCGCGVRGDYAEHLVAELADQQLLNPLLALPAAMLAAVRELAAQP